MGAVVKVGDDLLSRFRSTIGAGGLNFSVRNGKRWNPAAIVTLKPYNILTYRKKLIRRTTPKVSGY